MTSKVISQTSPLPTASPGIADIVGFGAEGVIILRISNQSIGQTLPAHTPGSGILGFRTQGTQGVVNLRNPISNQSIKVINKFGYDAGGWRTERHVRLIADTTGDKQADIVGFGEEGVWISLNKGNNTFTDLPHMVLAEFSYDNGDWRVDKHIRCSSHTRDAVADFGYNGGWRLDKHLRFLADVTGDGLLDIVAFGERQVLIGRNNGDGTFQPGQGVVSDFCYSGGWRVDNHPRFVADLTGDGRADLIGFGDAGVSVSLNDGSGAFGPVTLALNDFGCNTDAGGWSVEKHLRFIASLTGDKRGDIVAFGNKGVYIAINNGNGTFQPSRRVIDDFGYNQGWQVEKRPRFACDLTGDWRADIIGFGDDSVGEGNFGPVTKLIDDFGYNEGWTLEKTVRYVANLHL
ncbi:hypothetical protein MVEN_00624600 [Mycena venus]|uniref:Uncharacterized protein n=1 Tax=Mycena venus TaxID=2733690 RepID=A0A8H6YQZ9_9AGAR|nr:hypothetical protein MVEN_00624600 [Mycena venus]